MKPTYWKRYIFVMICSLWNWPTFDPIFVTNPWNMIVCSVPSAPPASHGGELNCSHILRAIVLFSSVHCAIVQFCNFALWNSALCNAHTTTLPLLEVHHPGGPPHRGLPRRPRPLCHRLQPSLHQLCRLKARGQEDRLRSVNCWSHKVTKIEVGAHPFLIPKFLNLIWSPARLKGTFCTE